MSATTADAGHAAAAEWRFGEKVGDWIIGLVAFLGAFVMDEPAPYELVLCVVMVVWTFFGLRLSRHFLPMTILMLLYVAGGILGVPESIYFSEAVTYVATTLFLALSAIFFASVVAEAPERRLNVIKKAYIASAAIAAFLGICGYFHLFPGADLFTRYDRIKATFQDPNVFGPFAVLAIVMLYQDIIASRLGASLGRIAVMLVLLLAVFLAFSRAAWGMTVLGVLLVSFFAFLNEKRQIQRFRIVAYLIAGAAIAALLVTVALSIPAVRDLWEQRAQLVQNYDAGPTGRFERHIIGFFLVQEHPFGLGPFGFGRIFGEDEHNTWLKGFTTYGWLGGFAYIILVVWTLVAATPLLFKPRPWTPIIQCVYAVFIGQIMLHNVIDNDHWRHVFLIYGLLWGGVAAEKNTVRAARIGAPARRPVATVQRVPAAAIPRGPRPAARAMRPA